jgi:hypothetical protein
LRDAAGVAEAVELSDPFSLVPASTRASRASIQHRLSLSRARPDLRVCCNNGFSVVSDHEAPRLRCWLSRSAARKTIGGPVVRLRSSATFVTRGRKIGRKLNIGESSHGSNRGYEEAPKSRRRAAVGTQHRLPLSRARPDLRVCCNNGGLA